MNSRPMSFAKGLLSLLIVSSLLTACSSRGFKRDEMFAQLNQETEITDAEIATTLKLKPQLPRPFKLAIYFQSPRSGEFDYYSTRWSWTDAEKQQVASALGPLNKRGIVSEVIFIPQTIVEGNGLKAVRLAAARHGADAVLIVRGGADVDSFNNAWAYTYVLVAPAFFAPGNEAKSLFISHASLWDVRNEYLYLTAEGDAESQQVRPSPFIDKEKLVADAKADSVSQLSVKLRDLSENFEKAKGR